MRLPHARNFRRKGLVTRLVLVQLGLVFMDTNSCILFLFGNDIQQTKLCFKTDAPLPCGYAMAWAVPLLIVVPLAALKNILLMLHRIGVLLNTPQYISLDNLRKSFWFL